MIDAEFFVAAAFLVFLAVMIYFEVHKVIVETIDRRTAQIRAELDEARRLRAEAQSLLDEYRRKQHFKPAHEERRDKIRAAERKLARARAKRRPG